MSVFYLSAMGKRHIFRYGSANLAAIISMIAEKPFTPVVTLDPNPGVEGQPVSIHINVDGPSGDYNCTVDYGDGSPLGNVLVAVP